MAVDRHVVALFIEPEPALAVGGVKPGVADAALELMHGIALPREPAEQHGGHQHEGVQEGLALIKSVRQNPRHISSLYS